eukprot:12054213-Heterocapsa_arctica.AAC.1
MAPVARRKDAHSRLGRTHRAGTRRREQNRGSTCATHILPTARRPTGGTTTPAHGQGRRRRRRFRIIRGVQGLRPL